jgi:hypothetical protein
MAGSEVLFPREFSQWQHGREKASNLRREI